MKFKGISFSRNLFADSKSKSLGILYRQFLLSRLFQSASSSDYVSWNLDVKKLFKNYFAAWTRILEDFLLILFPKPTRSKYTLRGPSVSDPYQTKPVSPKHSPPGYCVSCKTLYFHSALTRSI